MEVAQNHTPFCSSVCHWSYKLVPYHKNKSSHFYAARGYPVRYVDLTKVIGYHCERSNNGLKATKHTWISFTIVTVVSGRIASSYLKILKALHGYPNSKILIQRLLHRSYPSNIQRIHRHYDSQHIDPSNSDSTQTPSNLCTALHWRHNELDGVSSHRSLGYWLNRLFRRR